MKTKKLLLSLAGTFLFLNLMALDHGSMVVKDAPLYEIRDGAPAGQPVDGLSVDFKIVTIGSNTWAWTELKGSAIIGEDVSSQLRWWKGTNPADKRENNLTGRVPGTEQTYGQTSNLPETNPTVVTILQQIPPAGDWIFRETDDFTYDYTELNNADEADNTPPVLSEPSIVNKTATILELSLSASDASNEFFYYIVDEANDYEQVFFVNNPVLPLTEEIDYNFSIYAIDFSGNISEPKTIEVKGDKFECNNLLADKVLTAGEPYFAPGWNESDDYTYNITDNNLHISLLLATNAEWQSQFPVMFDVPVAVTPGKRYSILLDVETNKNLPFYVKFYDGEDNIFIDINRQTVNAPGGSLSNFDVVCPAGLNQISQILFDFGWNAAETDIIISGISICGESTDIGSGIYSVGKNSMSISQNNDMVTINSEDEIKSVTLYSISGQTIQVALSNNSFITSGLMNGLYILQVNDINGNESIFKVIIK